MDLSAAPAIDSVEYTHQEWVEWLEAGCPEDEAEEPPSLDAMTKGKSNKGKGKGQGEGSSKGAGVGNNNA